VITGIGKSAIIGQKIVATFNSTGTPALFMHAADAIHGDLGMMQQDDIVICISKSGNSPEIKALAPLIIKGGNTLVGMVGNMTSYLAEQSNYVLDTTVEIEACPNNLAPTTSTTAQMAMGDALAVALIKCRDFKSNDFAKYHPGGALGKKLYLTLADIAKDNTNPTVDEKATLSECIIAMTKGRMGAVIVLASDRIVGIITDGDLRRMLSEHTEIGHFKAIDIMTSGPKTLPNTTLAIDAVDFVKSNKINHIILEKEGNLSGIIHVQDLIREGLI
jgi:arabinose-5-phosphate isomerase